MVEAIQKLTKLGNSYGIIIPKKLLEWNILKADRPYRIIIEEIKTDDPQADPVHKSPTVLRTPFSIHEIALKRFKERQRPKAQLSLNKWVVI